MGLCGSKHGPKSQNSRKSPVRAQIKSWQKDVEVDIIPKFHIAQWATNSESSIKRIPRVCDSDNQTMLQLVVGHGETATESVNFISKHLPRCIENELNVLYNQIIKDPKDQATMVKPSDENIISALKESFVTIDRQIVDNDKINTEESGAVATLMCFLGQKVFICDLGNNVTMIGHRQSNSNPNLTTSTKPYQIISADHTPSNPAEAKRIIDYGGFCEKQSTPWGGVYGSPRVIYYEGQSPSTGLKTTRSFGDEVFHTVGCSALPGVRKRIIKPDTTKYIFIGSASVIEILNPEEIDSNLRKFSNPEEACEEIKTLVEEEMEDRCMSDETASFLILYFEDINNNKQDEIKETVSGQVHDITAALSSSMVTTGSGANSGGLSTSHHIDKEKASISASLVTLSSSNPTPKSIDIPPPSVVPSSSEEADIDYSDEGQISLSGPSNVI
eukprot:TRINITY_DN3549_c0_g2_i1.p1 TRINITY_DN3549_c0_g2~~TRINITY_DN3549_c0_g2_i1.p1  ORF type:complete len:444 (-),score=123.37 TRINITY_DN3549_c0_g2_i1:156-1487(-)